MTSHSHPEVLKVGGGQRVAKGRGEREEMSKGWNLEINTYAFQSTAALAADINQRKKEGDSWEKCKQHEFFR